MSEALSIRSKRPEKSTTDSVNNSTKQPYLLLLPTAAGVEILPKRLVLHIVPAETCAKAQSAARKKINISCLSGHKCGRALRKDQDARDKGDSLGDACEVAEHHERVVKGVPLGVGARQWRCSIGVNGSEHVVVGEDVSKAQILHRSSEFANGSRITPKFVLGVRDTYLHGQQLATTYESSVLGSRPLRVASPVHLNRVSQRSPRFGPSWRATPSRRRSRVSAEKDEVEPTIGWIVPAAIILKRSSWSRTPSACDGKFSPVARLNSSGFSV